MNRKTIENAVAAFRQKHGELTLPVDVQALAEKAGIDVRYEDLEDSVSGALFAQDGRAVMAINRNHPPRRQRFTLAHETGHFVLHWSKGSEATAFVDASLSPRPLLRDNRSKEGTSNIEMEANAFAAELLMPRAEVINLANTPGFDLHDEAVIRKMTGLFGVSEQALTVRLMSLGLIQILK